MLVKGATGVVARHSADCKFRKKLENISDLFKVALAILRIILCMCA